MRERWVLFYDGACPLCFRSKSWLNKNINQKIKLSAVDLNSEIAKSKGYNGDTVVLEASGKVYTSYRAWLKILSETKFKFFSNAIFRPLFIIMYYIISKNRKLISYFL